MHNKEGLSPLLCSPPLPGGAGSDLAGLHLPHLAEGVELLGPYQGSGSKEPPYLVKRADGRMLEISQLLYLVASGLAADAPHSAVALAQRVTTAFGRELSTTQMVWLVEHKLRPLGLLTEPSEAQVMPANERHQVLAPALRTTVLPARFVQAATAVARPLFLPEVIVTALLGLVAVDLDLGSGPGLAQGLHQVIARPGLLLMLSGLMIVGGAFHELGHATASRYGGALPGDISVGIYLVWPVFSNNLNDSYRLSRAGRLRTDLGGVYFNAVFVLALASAYGITGFRPLLVAILAQHLSILEQFLPFVRLDGYYLVSDAVGVPDLFGKIRPILASMVPGRTIPSAVGGLRPSTRAMVTAWVLITVSVLSAGIVMAGLYLPGVLASAGRALVIHAQGVGTGLVAGHPSSALLGLLQVIALLVPFTGFAVVLQRLLRRVYLQSRLVTRWRD